MRNYLLLLMTFILVTSFEVTAKETSDTAHYNTPSELIERQRKKLAKHVANHGFGPQSPRNIDSTSGSNSRIFSLAPPREQMNLCNIHFHRNAEHAGGEFDTYAGNGDGLGHGTGYVYSGPLSNAERAAVDKKVCAGKHDSLQSGDTLEVHYVHSTAKVEPGPTLRSCLNETVKNPQFRVETQVIVLVNNASALDFVKLAQHKRVNGYYQALNIPTNTGLSVEYAGSTTGPAYNEKGSPFEVTWNVRPRVAKVNINTMDQWCEDNVFDEDHAHGVRNLITNPDLLSEISP